MEYLFGDTLSIIGDCDVSLFKENVDTGGIYFAML